MPQPEQGPFTEILVLTTAPWGSPSETFSKQIGEMALRLTNILLKRQMEGVQVAVYWLVNAAEVAGLIENALKEEGCPDGAVKLLVIDVALDSGGDQSFVLTDDGGLQNRLSLSEVADDWDEETSAKIESIVEREHSSAIEFWPDETVFKLPCTYYGRECRGDYFDDSDVGFWLDKYAATLPLEHRSKAITWLGLLARKIEETDLDDLFEANAFMFDAVVLAYLLRRFEEIVDESESDFDGGELAEIIPISKIFVGTYLTEHQLIDICKEAYDPEHLLGDALALLAEQHAQDLVDRLVPYFGSDANLFYSLLVTKRPGYSRNLEERIDETLNRNVWSSKLDAYEFVQVSKIADKNVQQP